MVLGLAVGGRTATLVLAVVAVAYLGTVPVLGTTAAAELSFGIGVNPAVQARGLAPGDRWSEVLRVLNLCSEPLTYQLSFVTRGELWHCDPGPSNLTYRVVWGEDVDWRLEPGEIEIATIVLHFPLAAGNECQGRSGSLLVYRGLVQSARSGGSQECCRVSFVPRGSKRRNEDSPSDGLYFRDLLKTEHVPVDSDVPK